MRLGFLGLLVTAVVACEGVGESGPTPSATPSQTATAAALVGISPDCAAAFERAVEGFKDPRDAFTLVANRAAVLNGCATVAELESAGRQLGIDYNWGYLAESSCRFFELPEVEGAAICESLPEETPTPVPTPTPLTASEAHYRNLCEGAKPADLYGVTEPVRQASGTTIRDGVHVVLLEFKDLDGAVGPVPAVRRGFIYDFDEPIFAVEPSATRLLACVALRAVEEEQWGTSGPLGTVQCPCTTVFASDALIWIVDPAAGQLVGRPWLREPIDVGTHETHMILAGLDGPGVRPPEPGDIVADMEAFLGL